LAALPARAQSGCDAAGNGLERLQCRLPGVLHLLEVLAAVLAAVLLIVVIVAVRTYRRNQDSQP
jgi:hypothetical protein